MQQRDNRQRLKTAELEQMDHTETSTIWQEFSVPYRFRVCFTQALFHPDNPLLQQTMSSLEPMKCHRFIVFVDEGLVEAQPQLIGNIKQYAAACAGKLELLCEPITMPGGEAIKSDMHFVEKMQSIIVDHHVDRHSYVVGIGGGALLDAVGLVAATSHRGIRHIRVPSTVLSQNDSGVGVKNGVNLFGQKNYLGTFNPPFAVLNDYDFIENLPARDKIAGMAEAVKVALIRDPEFYDWLEQNADALATFSAAAMQYMIKRCAELHMAQIGRGGDPFETGSARPLDFGHWAAHRLETLTRYHLRHGEAVAIGIALDARYSVLAGLLNAGCEERICFLLEHFGFKLWHPALETTNKEGRLDVIQGLTDFREHLGGELTITLLSELGTGIEVHEMHEERVTDAIKWLKLRCGK